MARKQKFDYFDAFDRQADLALQESRLLVEIIENYTSGEELETYLLRAHEIEHEGDTICHALYSELGSDFITPIEREDILAMAQTLDDVVDYIEGTIQRFYMLNIKTMHPDAIEFARLLLKASEALVAAMEDFRNFKNSKKLRQLLIDVNDVEEETDALFMRVMHELYANEEDVRLVMVWDKIFQRLEYAADSCEKVSDTMNSIMMKNS